MKWQAVEKVRGVRDYTKGDTIRAHFDAKGIPLSGNTLIWEVPDKATPFWYRNELEGSIETDTFFQETSIAFSSFEQVF